LDKDNDIEHFNNLAESKFKSGLYQDAITEYDRIIKHNPESTLAYNNRGLSNYGLGQYEEAVEDFNRALEIDPYNKSVYNNRGMAKYGLGLYREAAEDFNRALKIDPGYASAYNNRGLCKNKSGHYDKAIRDYNTALTLDTGNAEVYCNRAVSKHGLGLYGEAVEDYDRALGIDPKCRKAYSGRARSYLELGLYEESIRDCERVTGLSDRYDKDIYNIRGLSMHGLGLYENAIDSFNTALKIDPGLGQVLNQRGNSKWKSENYSGAVLDYYLSETADVIACEPLTGLNGIYWTLRDLKTRLIMDLFREYEIEDYDRIEYQIIQVFLIVPNRKTKKFDYEGSIILFHGNDRPRAVLFHWEDNVWA
jgi:tetratricopeptide (TPR) repeat protein